MKNEKRQYLSKEAQKRLVSLPQYNVSLFIQPLKIIKEKLSPLDLHKQRENSDQVNTFENDLTHMVSEI